MNQQPNQRHTEVAVVGAGIVGLAHALAAAKQGYQVTVFERRPQASGASIRNFGMVWPIGQPAGFLYERAMRSRQIWLEMADKAGFFRDPVGSLHLTYREDEAQVLEEFVAGASDRPVRLLSPQEVAQKSPAAVIDGLKAALWSETEVIVDAREAIRALPSALTAHYGVQFHFGTVVTQIAAPHFTAGGLGWTADQIFVCSGEDFETLYPEVFRNSGITKTKLQMMRTVPQPNHWRLGPALCGGLTLTHYAAFAHCPSLPALKTRIEQEMPFAPQWGIHVMASQNGLGELVLGDSHEYGLNPDPFDRTEINEFVLNYLKTFVQPPTLQLAATWHGIYAKLPGQTEFIARPEPGVAIINALGGAGMTLSFGLAEKVV